MKANKNLLYLAEETIAEFLGGKTIKEVRCCEFGCTLVFGDGSTMKLDIGADKYVGDPFLRYDLDGQNPYKFKA